MEPETSGTKDITENNKNKDLYIQQDDNNFGYNLNIVFNQKKYEEIVKTTFNKKNLTYRAGIFTKISNQLRLQERKTYYSIVTQERAIEINNKHISDLKTLNKQDFNNIFEKMNSKDKQKMKYLYIGGIEIIVESLLREGIDSPIAIVVRDKRLTNYEDSILGKITGNLSYKKLAFTIYPRYSVSLNDKNIYDIMTIEYYYAKKDLMIKGNAPINIRYVVGITISNQTGLDMLDKHEKIEVTPSFEDITIRELPKVTYTNYENIEKVHNQMLSTLSERYDTQRTSISKEKEYNQIIKRNLFEKDLYSDEEEVPIIQDTLPNRRSINLNRDIDQLKNNVQKILKAIE